MILVISTLLTAGFLSCAADSLNLLAPMPVEWANFDNNTAANGKIFMVDGTSVMEKTADHCALLSPESCVKLQDAISLNYYGVAYTPSRPSSNIEDYHATRKDVIRYLTNRFKYKHYLEIGCQKDLTFANVQDLYEYAYGVDPVSGGTHRMTSDEFFHQNTLTFDIIFVDGLHTGPQVFRDVMNSLQVLEEGGTIVLHDLNPRRKDIQNREPPDDLNKIWNGDCWRAAVALRLVNEMEIVVADFDHGVGVLRLQPNQHRLPTVWENRIMNAGGWQEEAMPFLEAISYEEFDQYRDTFLRLVTFRELRMWLENVSIGH